MIDCDQGEEGREQEGLKVDAKIRRMQMNQDELRRYALAGAEARLLAIAEEAAAIYRVFPELLDRGGKGVPAVNGKSEGSEATKGRKTGRRRMSAAQRKAVGERMKKYWAARRGEKTGSQQPAAGNRAQGQSADTKLADTPPMAKRLSPSRAAAMNKSVARGQRRGPRRMSAAARKRISEAQKARWAKRKGSRANAT